MTKSKRRTSLLDESDFLYGLSDLADFLKVSKRTATRLHRENRFPVIEAGHKLRFRKADVLKGLERR